ILALACQRSGDLARARQAADTGARLLAKYKPVSEYPMRGYIGLAEVYLALWEDELAQSGADSAAGSTQSREDSKTRGQTDLRAFVTSRLGVKKLRGYFRRVERGGPSIPDPTLRAAARSAIQAVRTAARTFHVSRPSRWRLDASYAWLDGRSARARQLW